MSYPELTELKSNKRIRKPPTKKQSCPQVS